MDYKIVKKKKEKEGSRKKTYMSAATFQEVLTIGHILVTVVQW
jgi:hypothetical protein